MPRAQQTSLRIKEDFHFASKWGPKAECDRCRTRFPIGKKVCPNCGLKNADKDAYVAEYNAIERDKAHRE